MRSRKTNILIVDDEPQVGELIRRQLCEGACHSDPSGVKTRFDCQVTADPQRAMELLDRERFDVVITDIVMPRISGLDLLVHARRQQPACKVILMTGVTNRDRVAQALMLGAFDYVEKPFGADELLRVVSQAATSEPDVLELPIRAAKALQANRQTCQASLDSVRALARAVEAKDPHTRRHSEHVTHYATNLAKVLDATPAMLESLRVASLLHDVGKIGVPDRILTKAGPLTGEEFALVRRHSALGADILANITLFTREAEIIRHHHEAWNGRGYPDGLACEEIPLASRIINVADAMDAMLMARSYKQAYSVDQMLSELIRCAGTQFDRRVASAAVQWASENPGLLIASPRALENVA